MEGKVAVLGSEDFVLPFTALGLDVYAVQQDQAEQIRETAQQIIDQDYGLVVIAENIARQMEAIYEDTLRETLPSMLVVPFLRESEGFATDKLGEIVKLATGINLFAEE